MKWNEFKKEPILIGGCGRSGTTLLLSILGAHPNIYAIPDETQIFCPGAYKADSEVIENKVSATFDREQLFEQRMQNLDLNAEIDISKIDNYLENIKTDHSRWCEKTPKNILFIEKILALFENKVKFIHIVRDGRDVVTSVHPGRNTYHVPFQRWITEVSVGLSFKDHPSVYTMKYENLILDFRTEMQKLCDFIEEPFDERLSNWFISTNVKEHNSYHGENVSPLYRNAIGRWKLPEFNERIELFMKNKEARACLDKLGYLF